MNIQIPSLTQKIHSEPTHRSYQVLTPPGPPNPKPKAASPPRPTPKSPRFPAAKSGPSDRVRGGSSGFGEGRREETEGGLTGARGTGREREAETEARGGRRRHCSCCCRESSHPHLASPRQLNTPPPHGRSRWRGGGRRPQQAGSVASASRGFAFAFPYRAAPVPACQRGAARFGLGLECAPPSIPAKPNFGNDKDKFRQGQNMAGK
jgi:hypothetical protein